MFELLFEKLEEKVGLTADEKELVKTYFIPKKLRKRQYLLQEGDPCRYTAFIEKGLLRSYHIDDKGAEHMVQFGMEGWWIADMYSFLTGEPSAYNIDALEDSELLLITRPAQEELLLKLPQFERYLRLLIQNAYVALQRRLVVSLTQTAEEKYSSLMAICPTLTQRMPQHMIASYLGVTPETLSRVRKGMAAKK